MRPIVLSGVALIVFWAVSLTLSYAGLGAASLPVALLIAVVKAAIVALVFMELKTARASVVLAFLAGVAMLMLLLTFTVADVLTR